MLRTRVLIACALLLTGIPGPGRTLRAQGNATLSGTVVDTAGRPIDGARLVLWGRGATPVRAATDAQGAYRFPALRSGVPYRLEVEHPGRRTIHFEGLRLETGRTRVLDVRLKRPGERDIVVLVSRDPFPHATVVDAVLERIEVPSRTYDLDADSDPAATVRRVRAERPNLIIGAGLAAARLIRREVGDIPAILTLISDPRRYDLKAANICFIANNPAPRDLTRRIKELLPGARRLGLVFDAQASPRLARDIRGAARREGLSVELRPAYRPQDLEAALRALRGRIDVLAVPYDPLTSTTEAADLVSRWALRNRLPVAAADPAWVHHGALFSYGASLHSIGQEAAWVARQILFHGRQPADFALRSPRGGPPRVNEVTALALEVPIPPGVNVELWR
jgi:putative ABC transport system substrate-binding protein